MRNSRGPDDGHDTSPDRHSRASHRPPACTTRTSGARLGRDRPRLRANFAPSLIVVTGAPGSGKTSVARPLAERLGLPLFAKDDVKEALWDHFGAGDRELFLAYGRASYPLLLGFARAALAAGRSAIVEANFRPHMAVSDFEQLLDSTPCRVVQVLCIADPETCLQRYRERDRLGRRHAMHLVGGVETEAGLERELRDGVWDVPIPLAGAVFRLDTNELVDVEALAREIVAQGV